MIAQIVSDPYSLVFLITAIPCAVALAYQVLS